MRFIITLSMASFSNNLVHQIICDHESESVNDFADALNEYQFIVVDQYYNIEDKNTGKREWEYKGPLILNTNVVGKVQQYVDKDITVERFRRESISLRNRR